MYLFTDDCITGMDSIDEQHKRLFDIINRTQDLLENAYREDKYDSIKDLVKELEEYADIHFDYEEVYMRRTGHPDLAVQKEQHNHFRMKVDELAVDGMGDTERQDEVIEDILKYLVRWLYKHIIGSDMLIGKLKPLEEWRKQKSSYEFGDEYLTGISFVDKEHKELFRIIGEVDKLLRDDYKADKYDDIVFLLKQLKDYTEYHFKDEEEYMKKIRYEELEMQQLQHEAFIERLREVDLEAIDEGQQEYLEELLEFLTEWLVNHILRMDKKIPLV